jgi:hypothetical protein
LLVLFEASSVAARNAPLPPQLAEKTPQPFVDISARTAIIQKLNKKTIYTIHQICSDSKTRLAMLPSPPRPA